MPRRTDKWWTYKYLSVRCLIIVDKSYNIYLLLMLVNSQDREQPNTSFNQLIQTVSEVFRKSERYQCQLQFHKVILQMKEKMFQNESEKIEKMVEIKHLTKKCNNQKMIIQILELEKQESQRKQKLAQDQIKGLQQLISQIKGHKKELEEYYQQFIEEKRNSILQIEKANKKKQEAMVSKFSDKIAQYQKNYDIKVMQNQEMHRMYSQAECKLKTKTEEAEMLKKLIIESLGGAQQESTVDDAISLLQQAKNFIRSTKDEIKEAKIQIREITGKKIPNVFPEEVKGIMGYLMDIFKNQKKKDQQNMDKIESRLNRLLEISYPEREKIYGLELVQSVQRMVNQYKSQIAAKQIQWQMFYHENQNHAASQIADLKKKQGELESQNKKLQSTISELKTDLENERKQKEGIGRENQKLSHLLTKLKKQKQQEAQKIKKLEGDVDRLKSKNQSLQNGIRQLEKVSEGHRKAIVNLEAQRQLLKQTLDKVRRNRGEESSKATQTLQLQVQKLKEKINDMQIELQTLRQKKDNDDQEHLKQLNQLRLQMPNSSKSKVQIDELTLNLEQKSNKLQIAEQKIRMLKNQHQKELDQLHLQNKNLLTKIQAIVEQVIRMAKIKYPNASSFQQSLQLLEQSLAQKANIQTSQQSVRLFVPPFISESFQDKMKWVIDILNSNVKLGQNIKSRFVGKVSKAGQDYTKFLQNPNTLILCQNIKTVFCIFITKLGKTQTDNDPVMIFSPSQQLRYPKTNIKGKGYRTSFINPKGDLILGKIEVIIQKTPFQISGAKQTSYFGEIDYSKLFGMALGQKLPILSMQFYCLQE